MKRTLLAKHTRLCEKLKLAFRCVVFLFITPLFLFSFFTSSFSQEIRTLKDLSPELIRKIEEVVETFREPLKKKEYDGIISRTEGEVRKAFNESEKKITQLCSQKNSTNLYYFFSFSMPEELVLGAMREAVRVNRECGEQVTLVLRGFVKNDLRATINVLYKYLRKIGDDIPVEIDPELFEQFQIKAVPQILKVMDEKIGIIKGDLVGLGFAISRFQEELKDYGLYGKLYPINEDDPLKVFASRQREIEKRLRERLPEIRKRIVVLSKYDGTFEHVKETRTYYLDPNVVLRDNIYDHHGRVIIQKGTVYNPADYFKLGRYVVIDGNSPEQVKFAIGGDFRRIILISGNLEKLVNAYRKPFYFANDQLIERFQIKRVPVVIEGEGKRVRITEMAL